MSATRTLPFAVLIITGCHCADVDHLTEAQPAAAVSVKDQELIGDAKMNEKGVIHVWLRAEMPGMHGDAFFDVAPGTPDYARWIEHLGGLKPGESKGVRPWPENSNEAKKPIQSPQTTPVSAPR